MTITSRSTTTRRRSGSASRGRDRRADSLQPICATRRAALGRGVVRDGLLVGALSQPRLRGRRRAGGHGQAARRRPRDGNPDGQARRRAALGFDAAASASRSGAFGPAADRSAALERVTIGRTTLEIQLAEGMAGDSSDRILVIPWTPPSPYRRREIIPGEGEQSAAVRPMRAEARGLLIDALRDAYCWLDELTTDSSRTIVSLAAREK